MSVSFFIRVARPAINTPPWHFVIAMGRRKKLPIYDVCKSGDMQEVLRRMEKNRANANEGFRGALAGGHNDIARLMLKRGAAPHSDGIYEACFNGHDDTVVHFLRPKEADLNKALEVACKGNQLQVARYLLKFKPSRLDDCLYVACGRSTDEMVKLLLDARAMRFDWALAAAVFALSASKARLVLEYYDKALGEGRTPRFDYSRILSTIAGLTCEEVARVILHYGVTHYERKKWVNALEEYYDPLNANKIPLYIMAEYGYRINYHDGQRLSEKRVGYLYHAKEYEGKEWINWNFCPSRFEAYVESWKKLVKPVISNYLIPDLAPIVVGYM